MAAPAPIANPPQTKTVALKTGELPKSQHKSFNVKPPTFRQHWSEKCLLAGQDRRKVRFIKTNKKHYRARNAFDLIGQLRVRINRQYFVGTALVIAFDYASCGQSYVYALTAAHNVCDANPITKQTILASECWFHRMDTHYHWFWGQYAEINKTYRVQKLWIHPKYDATQHTPSQYDIAIIKFKAEAVYDYYCPHILRPYTKDFAISMSGLSGCRDIVDWHSAYLYGYPAEKAGQFWGMKAKVMAKQNGLLVYDDIDTSGGQSGSPIFIHQQRAAVMRKEGIPLVCIGVHVGGSAVAGKNWAVYLDKDKRSWIKEIVEKNAVKEVYFLVAFEPQTKRTPFFMTSNKLV